MKRPEAYDPGEWYADAGEATIIRALVRISEQLAYLTETLDAIEGNR